MVKVSLVSLLVCLMVSGASPLFMDEPSIENLMDEFWDYFFFFVMGLPLDPVDCGMSKWSGWSSCRPPNVKTRLRTVTREAAHGGSACPEKVDVKSCDAGDAGVGGEPGDDSGPTCYVEEGLPCVFPFVNQGYEHTEGCTHIDGDPNAWCATLTNEDGTVGPGGQGVAWGYCDSSCPVEVSLDDI